MLNTKIFLFLISILFAVSHMNAQIDTSLVLKEVELLSDVERNQNYGGKTQIVFQGELSNQDYQDLGQVLNNAAGIHIKSYGSNSLATSSIRGGSAGHTLLLWNGIPLLNPSLGLVDFALVPTGHSDLISLQKGGNSALWGSGAIGGVINLQNKKRVLKNRGSIASQIGSYGRAMFLGKTEYTFNGIAGSTIISHQKANNDFPFRASLNSEIENQKNAKFTSTNISQNLLFKIGKKQELAVHYWWQEAYKEIPATTTQTQNLSNQTDNAHRLLLDWNRLSPSTKLQAKLAFFDEDQLYLDPIINLNSNNQFVSLLSELSMTKWIKEKYQILVGGTFTNTYAKTNGYQEGIQENKLGLWASFRIQYNKVNFQSSIRHEYVDGARIPLTPSLGFEYALSNKITLAAKLSRNYRNPTLNDRYWSPGGDINLLPEDGWSEELNLTLKPNLFDQSQITISSFNRRIKNWILWSPAENQNFWRPQNLAEVWSRGFEIESRQVVKLQQLCIGLENFYNYVKSTNEIEINFPKIKKGEQLVYTPIHQLTNTVFLKRESLLFSLSHIYRSESKGINEDIDAYNLFNLSFQYKEISILKSRVDLSLDVNNIFDTQYFIIERRPLPLSNFNLGIKLNLNK